MSDYDQLAYNLRLPLSAYLMAYAPLLDLGRGTAFPTAGHDGEALQSGSRFFRTDLSFACVYDGTRWLTDFLLSGILATNPTSTAATNGNLRTIVGHDQYALYIVRCFYSFNVATTNNGTNYWTISFEGESSNFGALTTIDSHNTSANGPGAWNTFDVAPATPALSLANSRYLNLNATITAGAPGAISLICSAVYRLIIT